MLSLVDLDALAVRMRELLLLSLLPMEVKPKATQISAEAVNVKEEEEALTVILGGT